MARIVIARVDDVRIFVRRPSEKACGRDVHNEQFMFVYTQREKALRLTCVVAKVLEI